MTAARFGSLGSSSSDRHHDGAKGRFDPTYPDRNQYFGPAMRLQPPHRNDLDGTGMLV